VTAVRYWASAREAAGTAGEDVEGGTLAEALDQLRARHPDRLAQVLAVCSFVIDGDPVGARDPASVSLLGSEQVDVLPPFAGG